MVTPLTKTQEAVVTLSRLAPLILVLCAFTALHGQNPASTPIASALPSGSAIAVLNFNAAVLGTAEAQRQLGALEKKYSPREQQLQRLNEDIEAFKKTLSDSAKLSEAQKNEKLHELGSKEKQLQREADDFKNDSQSESQQAFQQVAQKVFSFLQAFSQQHGYAAVLERGTDTDPIVWYAASNVDITDQITRGYDAKFGPGASSLPETPSATQPPAGVTPKRH
jgi:outer membrane protein